MHMKKFAAAVTISLALTQTAQADVLTACAEDITTYCNDVVPGDGRIGACLYAYGGHVSDACFAETEVLDTFLERLFDKMSDIAAACTSDIETHCADIPPGGGNYIRCLKVQEATISNVCSTELAGFTLTEE